MLRICVQCLVLTLCVITQVWAVNPYQPILVDPILEPWRWRSFPEIGGQGLRCLVEDKDGDLWFGTDDGVKRYDGRVWVTYTPKDGVIGAPVNALCVTSDGHIYAGSEWGVSRFVNGHWQRVFPIEEDWPWPVDSIIEATNGDIWVGSTWGALRLANEEATLYTTAKIKNVVEGKLKNISFEIVPDAIAPIRTWPDGVGIRTISGHWFGLGRGYNPTIVWALAPDGPGERAGVLVGDRILEINHQKDLSQDNLDGKVGTAVMLTLVREGHEEPFDIQIEREVVAGTFRDFSVYDVFEAMDNALWFGLSSGSRGGGEIVRYQPGAATQADQWQLYTEANGLQIGYGPRIGQGQDGAIWTISQDARKGHNRFDGKTWLSGKLTDHQGADTNTDLISTKDGTFWIGGHQILHAYRNGTWTPYRAFDFGFPGYRHRLLETRDGALWVAGLGQEVARLDYDTPQWKTYEDLIVQCETPDGKLWFLSKDGEAICQTGDTWMRYGLEDGMLDSPVALFLTQAGTLWAIGSHNHIASTAQFDGKNWVLQQHPKFSWGIHPRAFFEDMDGNIWFGATGPLGDDGTLGGILKYTPQSGTPFEKDSWTHFLPPEAPLSTYGMSQTPDGRIWVCGWWGTRYFDGQTWTLPDKEELWSSPVDVLANGPDGQLWVGTRNNGVLRLHNKIWTQYSVKEGLSEGRVRDILPTEDGGVWVVTSKGMSYFDGQTWTVKTHHHLANELVTLRNIKKESLWLNIVGGEWFWRGYADMAEADKVYKGIRTLKYQKEYQAPETKIVVSIDRIAQPGNLVISWTGEDAWKVTQSENIQYAWRLDSSDWTPFSSETNKVFFELPSGRHTFEVKARDLDFNEDMTPAVSHFTVLPPVWQQAWFVCMVLVFVGSIVVLAMRVIQRGRQLQDANAVLEQRVLERTAELERSNHDLQNFASIASHDLQEPLRKVTVFSDLLKSEFGDKLKGDGEVYLNYVVESTTRMQNLVQDLLAYSRVTIKASTFKLVDLNQVVNDVISDLQVRIEETNGRVEIGNLPTLEADVLHMRQLFQNLVGNSLKFHREGVPPIVQISSDMPLSDLANGNGAYCKLVVSDNGIGFDKKYEAQVFEVFQRLHSREEFEGTGIGLALCQKIAIRHGGTITAESKVGRGTSFTITLPLRQTQS